MQKSSRTAVLAACLAATVAVPIATWALGAQQVIKCYFKDCLVFADGSRLCEVKEVPCPKEAT
jgi:hypothetical protein